MATSQSTIDVLLDQLSSLPRVRERKMFGEYALHCDETVVALVCGNQPFVKITPPGRALVGERYREGEAYPGAKPSMVIGDAGFEPLAVPFQHSSNGDAGHGVFLRLRPPQVTGA